MKKNKNIIHNGDAMLLPKSLPYEAGKKDVQLNYIVEHFIPDREKINVCDYGCGNGLFLAALSNHPEKSIGIYLYIDEDENALTETGSHIFKTSQIQIPDSCKSENLDPNKYGGKFDLVIMHHLLHEVIRPHEMLEQAFELLKPSGKIVIGDLCFFHWYEPDHVFWNCETINELFDAKRFDVNCITHKDQSGRKSYLAFVSLKDGESYPKKFEMLPKIKSVYQKMKEYYRERIRATGGPFNKSPLDGQVYERLELHIIRRLEEIENILKERIASRPPHFTNIKEPEPNFVGRKEYLDAITEWYRDSNINIGALIGWGGEGKSSIARKWFDSLEENGIRPYGIFWWGFYRNPYLERFLDSLLDYLAQGRINLNEIKSTWAKVDKINELIQEGEYLIVLDGLEEMQKGEEVGAEFGCMIHRELIEILTNLADSKAKGLCLITTRYPLTDIKNWEEKTFQEKEVESLSIEDARLLFEKIGVKGSQDDIDATIKEFNGHVLSLTLLANYLVKDFKGDIKKAKDIPPFYSDKEAGGKAHRMLLWYAKQLSQEQLAFMKIFSLFRRAINEKDFEGVFRSEMETPINKPLRDMNFFSFKRMIDNLCDRRLITKGQDDTYTTHPLIKNYFESIFEEPDKKLCHKRIYQYFGEIALEKPEIPEILEGMQIGIIGKQHNLLLSFQPKTLEGMKTLFEQVYHGCSASLYDEVFNEVFMDKIHRREKRFIVYNLGAWETDLLLIKTFFPKGDLSGMPLVSEEIARCYLFNEAGLVLLNTGKSKEAKEPLLAGIQMAIETKDWVNASMGYQNLAELQFRIGELENGAKDAEEALRLAEKAGSDSYIMASKTYLAYMLYLLGKNKDADGLFSQADELHVKIDGERLYSILGIFYAESFLSTNRIDEASKLTIKNLEICKMEKWPDDISRCHRLLSNIERTKGNYKEAEAHLKKAIDLAKNVGMPSLQIEALLEFGRLYLDIKKYKDAIRDANEVMKICERTGFKLYEPDAEVVLAKVYLAQGEIDKAKQFAQSGYDNASEMHYHWPKVEAEELLKELSR